MASPPGTSRFAWPRRRRRTRVAVYSGLTRRSTFRGIVWLVAVLMLVQSLPVDVLRGRAASVAYAADPVLWVDSLGGCRGQTPCHSTIQHAIDAVAPGQTVRILPGEYREQLVIKQKNTQRSAAEPDRIVIEADPLSAVGSVVLRGNGDRCEAGYAVDVSRSSYVTLRGLTITGAGTRGLVLRGGSRDNRGIHIERNRIFSAVGKRACSGGIDVGRGNPDTVIANNLLYANARHGIRFRDGRGGSHLVVGNTIARNGWSGIQITPHARVRIWNNVVAFNGAARGSQGGGRHGIWRQRSSRAAATDVELASNLICGNRLGELAGPLLDDGDRDNQTPSGS